MLKACKLVVVLTITFLFTSGCWNLQEPNQLAFDMASGMDAADDGKVDFSAQIAVPTSQGGGDKSDGAGKYVVESATGENVYDAINNLQGKLSRKVFLGHRKVILVGQKLAERGIGSLLDGYLDNPQSELRSRIFVVKGSKAKEALNQKPIFETFTSDMLLGQLASMQFRHSYFRYFVTDTLKPWTSPICAAIALKGGLQPDYAGTAVFSKAPGVKLAGFLDKQESAYLYWIRKQSYGSALTIRIPRGKGNFSVRLTSLKSRLTPRISGNRIQMAVLLTADATNVENNTDMDPTKLNNMLVIQRELSGEVQKSVERLLDKGQHRFKTDIFGIGDTFHQKKPQVWKTLRGKWNEVYPHMEVDVQAHIRLISSGQTGLPIRE